MNAEKTLKKKLVRIEITYPQRLCSIDARPDGLIQKSQVAPESQLLYLLIKLNLLLFLFGFQILAVCLTGLSWAKTEENAVAETAVDLVGAEG